MGLIAWYPLKNDIKDYSINFNDLVNSSPANIVLDATNGRLGKSHNFNGTGYLSSKNPVSYTKVTYAAWLYYPSAAGASSASYHSIVGSYKQNPSGYNAGMCITKSSRKISVFVPDNSDNLGSVVYTSTIAIEYDKWSHIAVTIDLVTGLISFYLNGICLDTNNILSPNIPVVIQSKEIIIGQLAWSDLINYGLYGKLNDVRVYDEILTQKQIRDIYRTCILRYDLSNPYSEPTQNLLNISDTNWSINKSNYQGTFSVLTSSEPWWIKTGAHFMFADKLDALSGGWQVAHYNIGILSFDTSNLYTLSFDLKIINGANLSLQIARINGLEVLLGPNAISGNLYGEWKRYTITFTPLLSASVADTTIYIMSSPLADFMIANPQIEKKNHATPFITGSRDGDVRDTSGYENNSIIQADTTPAYSVNHNVGMGSYLFNKLSYIQGTNAIDIARDQLTLSAWVFPTGIPTDGMGIILQQADNFYLAMDSNYKVSVYWYETEPAGYHTSNAALPLNQWSHIVSTWDGQYNKIYINGVLDKQTTVIYPGRSTSASAITIGKEVFWRGFDGNINDVRIYATALSGADIKSLYEARYALDLNGDFYCSEIVESDIEIDGKFELTEDGVLLCNEIDELGIYGMQYKMLDDGSEWAKIFHHNNRAGTVLFTSNEEALNIKSTDKYSKLNLLEKFRGTDGKFEMMLEYPLDLIGFNRWKQTSDPTIVTTPNNGVIGYEAIDIDWTVSGWGGLEYNGVTTFIDGNIGAGGYYSIGRIEPWNNAMPGPNGSVSYVELWVRIDTVDINSGVFKFSDDNIAMGHSINEL